MDTGKENKNNVCVAVIDDNAQLREMPVKQLENSGYTVLFQTGDGQDALQKLKENNRLPDVCLIEEDFATAKVLLEKHPDLKVLISSTEDDTESVTDMLKAGVSGYILKFADPDELRTAVKALSENKKYFSVGVSRIATEYFNGNTGEHY
ncbi:response regulator [Sphingobacterium corticibacter]|uniref:DNA-binding response regulator n=1 Tax=Sphingobacterium corticibacter TaxID=2171749 RepID=A0A2T8HGE9_9SPHI|nr:response regulator transcription factor [Sphingobacterium corticibacter]PVH24483.1 DNA-binding response regulator [Sphingobacterium corticibacter]